MGGSGSARPPGGVDEVLAHFGVKGMRWGVRRSSTSSTASEDAKRVAATKTKIRFGNTSRLSNKELQDVVTRMNLEQQYSNLTSKKRSNDMETAKFIKDTLILVGKSPATKLAVKFAAKQVASLLNK